MDKSEYHVIKSSSVQLTTNNTAYLIPPYPLPDRQILIIYNPNENLIYIGGSDVTIESGLPLKSGDYFIITILNFVYAVSNNDSQTVRVTEVA